MFEHPFINGLEELSIDDLSSKINELNHKLSIAMRTGNGHLCDQIRMALISYTSRHNQKLQEVYSANSGNAEVFNNKIDIS